MALREELLPPKIIPSRKAEIINLLNKLHENGATEEDLDVFNEFTGKVFEWFDISEYYSYSSKEEFVDMVATPEANFDLVQSVTEVELIEIMTLYCSGDISIREESWYRDIIHRRVPHPGFTKLIHEPKPDGSKRTPEEVVKEALAYKAIAL